MNLEYNKPYCLMSALIRGAACGLVCLVLLAAGAASGQIPATNQAGPSPTPDPLMTLMLSQPRIDVESPVRPLVAFEPRVIAPGGQATYRVVLNAMEAAIAWPEHLPEVAGLPLRAGGHGQVLQPGGPNLEPRTTFLYRANPKSAGRYTIPAFDIKVYGRKVTIPAATLEVVEVPAGITLPKPQLLYLELPATNLFVGEAVRARLTLPSDTNGLSQTLAYVRFLGDGFVADQSSAQQRIVSVPGANGAPSTANFIYELFITPIASGEVSLLAQGYTASSRFSGPLIISGGTVSFGGGPPQFTLLDSDPVTLKVRPLPKTGVLPGFKGAVGQFHLDQPRLATNVVQVGQPVKLKVTVRGNGNLARLVPPDPPQNKEWQIFNAPLEGASPQVTHLQGFVVFNFTLIPLSTGPKTTPPIPYSFFDPATETYTDLTIPSAAISLQPAPGAPAAAPEEEPLPEGTVETLQLADLAVAPGPITTRIPTQERSWFLCLQLLPALVFAGLFAWDRRRRFLETHPEVLVHRKARRHLRKHRAAMRSFARSGDASRFAEAAVRAMQTGCAPFFPATPEALVGADVISLLPATQQAGPAGAAVRLAFGVVDAARFGGPALDANTVLNHGFEIERVLAFLEAQLES